ncbi:MAG TPA: hypothetical protein VK983_05115 [Candidatus Limnocylindrales bacterium]|nr:hypothetical protein [Candidatus Limnocylindrales bacterium]
MPAPIAIIGFSFALRPEPLEPNPSNIELARAMIMCKHRLRPGTPAVMLAQWEIARALHWYNREEFRPALSVGPPTDGSYLDSRGVWEAAKTYCETHGIKVVVPVAQPFLHLPSVKQMIKKDGYTVLDIPIGKIPFDNSQFNTQPWTKSRFALLKYAIKIKLGRSHGQ